MFKYRVEVSREGSLMQAISRGLPLLPGQAVREALKRRDILVNQQRVNANVKVEAGDELLIYTPVAQKNIPILFEDEDSLVLNKPAGLSSDLAEPNEYTILDWARAHIGEGAQPALVHRLDTQASGLMVLAKNPASEQALNDSFKARTVLRQYICLVSGSPKPPQALLTAYSMKDAKAGRVTIDRHERPGSKQIITEYSTLSSGDVSRLLVTLHTGRTHQIRAHLAFVGHPLLGDEVYGSRQANRQHGARGLKLCAVRLGFAQDLALPGLAGRIFEIEPPF